MKALLADLLRTTLSQLHVTAPFIEITRPENALHGDYTTNVAFLIGKEQKKSPVEVAHSIVSFLNNKKKEPQKQKDFTILQDIKEFSIAGPGFINITLVSATLSSNISQVIKDKESYGTRRKQDTENKMDKIMVEFAHPNTHKAFHIGHLRNIITGESITRLLEATGYEVIRANYQGDVGMHIGKCLYALVTVPTFKEQVSAIRTQDIHAKIDLLGKAYAAGSTAYEEDEQAKRKIGEINKKIYAKDTEIYTLYQETRQWSLEYFDLIYKRLGSHFDRFYFESDVYESGKKNVEEGLKKGVFEESDGAIIFPGKKHGLHNRVFITSEGNPTYEGKEMGLGPLQFSEHHPDKIIHVVGSEQVGYFQVCFEALGQLFPETKGKEQHQVYGWVKLKHGKMSSRTGNVVLGEWLLDEVKTSIYNILHQSETKHDKEEQEIIAEVCAVAAVKYGFLRVGLSQEISFDIEESINIHGDSGPYLLYTYARCKSVGRKAEEPLVFNDQGSADLNSEERAIARLLFYFPEIVEEAAIHLSPSDVARYLTDLAQTFNLFYANHAILGNKNRLFLTAATAQVLKNGLYLLGIKTVERM